jgi:hypothetical protein
MYKNRHSSSKGALLVFGSKGLINEVEAKLMVFLVGENQSTSETG